LVGGRSPRPAGGAAAADPGGSQNVGQIARVYELVEENFATVPDADQAIYRGMIPGMLRTLDRIPLFSIRRLSGVARRGRRSTTAA